MSEIEEDSGPSGAPAWMATFADLMSLLMCFFVLLLSFSEMDVLKYKQLSGSMRNAFGVQNKMNVKHIPKGTSVIAREFSPGKPQPTQIKAINQFTTEITKPSLSVGNPEAPELDDKDLKALKDSKKLKERLSALFADTEKDAEKLRSSLKGEIANGSIDIESEAQTITIRIREKASFPSGLADLNKGFAPVIDKLRNSLQEIRGDISVEGHTDNIPVRGGKLKSNWDLSSSRALSVAHELFKKGTLDDNRFVVVGHADTKPWKPNDTPEQRAQNRRVEIVIRQSLEDEKAEQELSADAQPSASLADGSSEEQATAAKAESTDETEPATAKKKGETLVETETADNLAEPNSIESLDPQESSQQ